MAQNGSDNDLGWKPKNDNEWQSRMYANNTAQATDLSSSGGKQPSTFELSNPDTVGIFIQPSNWVSRAPDAGHVGFLIAEKGGAGNAIGYNYGRYTIEGEEDNPYSGKTPGRLLKESYPSDDWKMAVVLIMKLTRIRKGLAGFISNKWS